MRTTVIIALLLCVASAAYGERRARRGGLKIIDLISGKGANPEPAPSMVPKPQKPQNEGFQGFRLEDALAPAKKGNSGADGGDQSIKEELSNIERKLNALFYIEEKQMEILNSMNGRRP